MFTDCGVLHTYKRHLRDASSWILRFNSWSVTCGGVAYRVCPNNDVLKSDMKWFQSVHVRNCSSSIFAAYPPVITVIKHALLENPPFTIYRWFSHIKTSIDRDCPIFPWFHRISHWNPHLQEILHDSQRLNHGKPCLHSASIIPKKQEPSNRTLWMGSEWEPIHGLCMYIYK